MRSLAVVIVGSVVLSGCSLSSSVSGLYICSQPSIIQKLDFRTDDVVFVSAPATGLGEIPGTYKVDGDKISVLPTGIPGFVLTKSGDSVTGDFGSTFSCKKS